MADNEVVLPRFFKFFLSVTTSESMSIPTTFTEHLKDPLPKTAKLQGTGGGTWTVNFSRIRERAYITAGWSKFAEEHELKDGEYLTFVYDGECTFEVSVYGRWGCKETRAVMQWSSFLILMKKILQWPDASGVVVQTVENSDSDEEDTSMVDAPVVAGSSNLGAMTSIFFNTRLKKRIYDLLIPANVVNENDHELRFGENINFIDEEGTVVGERANFGDDRICFKGWDRICRRNKIKVQDKIECEMFHHRKLVHSVKIHITRG
ncbi:B3 domain-containing protein REM20 isoform X2 [Eutrema salsugineum]|uniref:B3 domain-containing protein REM20 isoform X2 n=1 Tax=Eutrema salsugineum TaxID=72664 RepID=UPI000CED4FA7|nr:B3 domain-containing protein REM20 isoform X2 [Eutrema salsugineum]